MFVAGAPYDPSWSPRVEEDAPPGVVVQVTRLSRKKGAPGGATGPVWARRRWFRCSGSRPCGRSELSRGIRLVAGLCWRDILDEVEATRTTCVGLGM